METSPKAVLLGKYSVRSNVSKTVSSRGKTVARPYTKVCLKRRLMELKEVGFENQRYN